jgi:hypothetical protein
MATHPKTAVVRTRIAGGMDQGRRPDIEEDLTKTYHVQWSYLREIPLSQFNAAKSRHNQARHEAIDDKVVATYAGAMKHGDRFPPVIAYKPAATSDYILIDGNHRLAAASVAELATLAVYEVDFETDPRTIALMTFALNTKHGMPTTESERVTQAVYLVENGTNLSMAAAALVLPERLLKAALMRGTADARADAVGFPRNKWDTMGQTVKNKLSTIHTDEGFHDATELAYAARLTYIEIQELISAVNSTRSGTKQRAIIKNLKDAYQDRIQGTAGGLMSTALQRRANPKRRASLAVGQALALPEDPKVIADTYAQPERADAAKKFAEAAVRFQGVADALLSMT